MEADLIQRLELPFQEIPAAGVHGINLRSLPGNLFKLVRGVFSSRRILKSFQPDVILYTGGYVAAPMAVAGAQTPSVVFVPDIEPGLALKFISRFATKIALVTEDSKQYFKKKSKLIVTGYPVRHELTRVPSPAAKQKFNLRSDLPVLLVYGGSKGAHSINQAVLNNLEPLLKRTQIIHLSGSKDYESLSSAKSALPDDLANRYQVFSYLHEDISHAFSAADLVVCRSGASALGELPYFGLPAILVPYPHAWKYQKVNADYLVKHQAAKIIVNEELETKLVSEINSLLDQPKLLNAMGNATKKLSKPDAAEKIAALLPLLAEKTEPKGGQG